MTRKLSSLLLVAALAAGAAGAWYFWGSSRVAPIASDPEELVGGDWLEHLYSQNPRVAEEAARQLKAQGAGAVPEIKAVLQDPSADLPAKKAALKASGMLGPIAAELIPEIAEHLTDPGLTAEAAVALSFLGREAFVPVRAALDSSDPVVRREALRSVGKLRERAPLDARAVTPLLIEGIMDPDPGVRTVAATYLGIIAEEADAAVPVLLEALRDEDAEVRSAAATALGSFPSAAPKVIPALRRATGDKNADVAREAGVSLVKLQSRAK